jgi:hypothetical protein
MTTDEYGLLSMSDIDPVDLRMSFGQWELQGLMPSDTALDHVSMYGTDLSDEENAENMYQMFVNLPAEVITQGVSRIHEEFFKFFRAEYFDDESNNKVGSLALLREIQQCFIDIQYRCVRATDELSRLVIETAATTCDTEGFSDTGACAGEANSAMEINSSPSGHTRRK